MSDRRPTPLRPRSSGVAAAIFRRSRKAYPTPVLRHCAPHIACPRSDRNSQGQPAAQSARCVRRRLAKAPASTGHPSPPGCPRPLTPSTSSCDPWRPPNSKKCHPRLGAKPAGGAMANSAISLQMVSQQPADKAQLKQDDQNIFNLAGEPLEFRRLLWMPPAAANDDALGRDLAVTNQM